MNLKKFLGDRLKLLSALWSCNAGLGIGTSVPPGRLTITAIWSEGHQLVTHSRNHRYVSEAKIDIIMV
jgi:hypothetical protein